MKLKGKFKGIVRLRGQNGMLLDVPNGKVLELDHNQEKNFENMIKFYVHSGHLELILDGDNQDEIESDKNENKAEKSEDKAKRIEEIKKEVKELQNEFRSSDNVERKEEIKTLVTNLKKELSSLK